MANTGLLGNKRTSSWEKLIRLRMDAAIQLKDQQVELVKAKTFQRGSERKEKGQHKKQKQSAQI